MPFSKISDFEKSFPAIKNLTPEQKQVCLEVFNSAKEAGDDDETAIKKAIGTANKAMSEDITEVLHLAEITEEHLSSTNFEILKAGTYYDPRYGKFTIDEKLINELAENFNAGILGVDVAVDVNHESQKGAIAWIKSLTAQGGKLYATLKDFSEEGKKFLREKIFKYFSVEFAPLEKVDESTGQRITVKNVLRGLAVTNRPVIKGMRPAFFSESLQFNNPLNMENFKLFAELLNKKDAVSKAEFATLKAMHLQLSEDEQAETKAEVEKAEAKVEEEKKEENTEGKAEEAKATESGVSAAEFAELKRQNAEKDKRLAQLELAEKERENSKRVDMLMLSEAGKAGFIDTPENRKELSELVSILPAEAFVKLSELLPKMVLLSEDQVKELGHGKHGNMMFAEKKTDGQKLTDRAKTIAEEKKISFREALKCAQDEMSKE